MQKIPQHITPEQRLSTALQGRLTLSISEAAKVLGVSETSIRRLIKRQLLKPVLLFRHILVPVEQLLKLIGVEGQLLPVPAKVTQPKKDKKPLTDQVAFPEQHSLETSGPYLHGFSPKEIMEIQNPSEKMAQMEVVTNDLEIIT